MAELPEKSEGRVASRKEPSNVGSDAEASRREARLPDDSDDTREEEGWTQPESSAQKGAERDEG
jgi:hypothetical protein